MPFIFSSSISTSGSFSFSRHWSEYFRRIRQKDARKSGSESLAISTTSTGSSGELAAAVAFSIVVGVFALGCCLCALPSFRRLRPPSSLAVTRVYDTIIFSIIAKGLCISFPSLILSMDTSRAWVCTIPTSPRQSWALLSVPYTPTSLTKLRTIIIPVIIKQRTNMSKPFESSECILDHPKNERSQTRQSNRLIKTERNNLSQVWILKEWITS